MAGILGFRASGREKGLYLRSSRHLRCMASSNHSKPWPLVGLGVLKTHTHVHTAVMCAYSYMYTIIYSCTCTCANPSHAHTPLDASSVGSNSIGLECVLGIGIFLKAVHQI